MNLKRDIIEGLLVGLLANTIGVYLYVAIFTKYDLINALKLAYNDEFLGALIAIGATLNFAPFFIYLKQNKIYKARGVLILSMLMAILILILNFKNL